MRGLIAVTLLAACAHNQELETKVDAVARSQRAQGSGAELQRKVDDLTAGLERLRARNADVEHQLDELAKLQQRTLELATNPTRPAPGPPRPRRAEADPAKTYAIPIAGDPSVGPGDAKVTVVLAYDYADPYTERTRAVLAALRKAHPKELRIVYKQFIVHPQTATAGALAACAAQQQRKFVELDEILWEKGFKARQFDKDDTTVTPPRHCWDTPGGCPIVLGFARELHLDLGRFVVDMKGCEKLVNDDQASLVPFGVGATPTFFINGRLLVGAQPEENFAAIVDQELALADQRIHNGAKPARYYQEWILDKGLRSLETP